MASRLYLRGVMLCMAAGEVSLFPRVLSMIASALPIASLEATVRKASHG